MLIIPMSSVTERRGDVHCPTVKWTSTLCFGPCSTAQKGTSSTHWAFRPSPEQESPKSSYSGTRLMTLVGRNSDGCDLDGQVVPSSSATCKGYPLALEYLLVGSNELWPLDQSNDPDPRGVLSFHAGVMAEEQAPASTSNTEEDEMAWVADEPRNTVSKFSLIQRPPLDDWKTCIPNTTRRICSKYQCGFFPTYQIAFEHMGYRLPFSDFEVAVFRYLHLIPSQLHPNSLAFIRAFEMTAVGFKDSYFFVKPLNYVAWQSVIYRAPAKDAIGAQLMSPDGRPVVEDYSRFPLSWRKSHYLKPASDFVYSAKELTVEELSNYEQMKVFVSGFPRKYYEDEEGKPILDEMGVPVTKKAFIDTKKLLACKNAAEMEACFQEMSTIAAKLRKSKAAKEKRQAAVLGSSSTAPPSPGGNNKDNARGAAVIVDLDDAGGNVENQTRPSKVARVDEVNTSAAGRVLSTEPKFVLPPTIGSPELVKRSPVALSDVEKAIMDDMGPEALKNELADAMVAAFKLMEISSFLNGRECKYLEERDATREEVVLTNQRLEQAKLDEKEAEAARLTAEKEGLEGRIKDLTAEKETLEGKVKDLESRPCSSAAAPDADELVVDPNGEYKGFTRAALVSRIFELEDQQLEIAKFNFDNAVAQLMVLNPGTDLIVIGASELKEVHDGVIVSPPQMKKIKLCSSNNYGCFLMWRIISTVPEQFVELHDIEHPIASWAFCRACKDVLSNDGARMEYSLVERAFPRRDLQPSLKSMSNYAIFNYSIVLAFRRSMYEGFPCRRDPRGDFPGFLCICGQYVRLQEVVYWGHPALVIDDIDVHDFYCLVDARFDATSCESVNILISSAPMSSANLNPTRKSSYSAWLFVVGNESPRNTSIRTPSPFSSMMSAPLPCEFEDPSMKMVHLFFSEVVDVVISATKSAILGDLDLDREWLFSGVGDLCRRILRKIFEAAREFSTARMRRFCSRIKSFCPRMLSSYSRRSCPCLLMVLTSAAITTSIGAPCGTCGTTSGSSGEGTWCGGGTSSGVTCACVALPSGVTDVSTPSDWWCGGFGGLFSPMNS
ncbi:hypothetical protein TSUD_236730 [Trifolium subterraneum]|uniref:Uncharacterized protein n=1 Tax=Trifolium subterraneum TaxID=3900 RepID=A0A2Z6NE55_TRISU|nr:hypothetical protein TSUD_236730 [Trifolium subterraneum]